MEITNKNFKATFPIVNEAINNADFLAFDCEFSGFGEGTTMVLPFDTPALVYAKAKENLGTYTVVQFGLCCFRFDSDKKKFTHKAFNFYVFPRLPSELSNLLRKKSTQYQTFACQADSLEFLSRQKFDFNKWIWNGVGYLKESVLTELKEVLTQKFDWRTKNDKSQQPSHIMKIPDAHKIEITNYMKLIDEFMKRPDSTLFLENVAGFEKRLLVNTVDNKYVGKIFYEYERNENEVFCLKLQKCNGETSMKDHQKAQHEKKLTLLADAAGFCNVIKAIRQSKKPMVGHNMYLDLLHTIKAFCCDLPTSYKEFKNLLHNWFPMVLDTKVVCAEQATKKLVGFANGLFQLYQRLEQEPFNFVESVAEDPAYHYEHCSENHHEAGYDAYLTGLVFLSLNEYLAKAKNGSERPSTSGVRWDIVSSLFNKIAPGRIVDMNFFDVGISPEADMCPDRSHVFHLTFSCEEWTNENIFQLFGPYGKIHIAWIDTGSCFITITDRKQTKAVIKNLIDEVSKSGQERNWSLKPSILYFKQQEALISGVGRCNQSRTLSEQSVEELSIKKMKLNANTSSSIGNGQTSNKH